MARLTQTHSEDAAGNVRRLEKLADEILGFLHLLEDCEETGDLANVGRSLSSIATTLQYMGADFTRWAGDDADNRDEICQDCGSLDLCPVCDACPQCGICGCDEDDEIADEED